MFVLNEFVEEKKEFNLYEFLYESKCHEMTIYKAMVESDVRELTEGIVTEGSRVKWSYKIKESLKAAAKWLREKWQVFVGWVMDKFRGRKMSEVDPKYSADVDQLLRCMDRYIKFFDMDEDYDDWVLELEDIEKSALELIQRIPVGELQKIPINTNNIKDAEKKVDTLCKLIFNAECHTNDKEEIKELEIKYRAINTVLDKLSKLTHKMV